MMRLEMTAKLMVDLIVSAAGFLLEYCFSFDMISSRSAKGPINKLHYTNRLEAFFRTTSTDHVSSRNEGKIDTKGSRQLRKSGDALLDTSAPTFRDRKLRNTASSLTLAMPS